MAAIQLGQPCPQSVLGALVLRGDGASVELASLYQGPVLIILLRHFGCVGCAEQVEVLTPRLAQIHELGASVVVVGNGEPRFIEGFIERHALTDYLEYPKFQLVTDPSLELYRHLGLRRSLWRTVGLGAAWSFLRGHGRGYQQRGIDGDLRQQGGLLMLDSDSKVRLYYRNRNLGDHADVNDVLDAVMTMSVRERGGRRGVV